jgi:hypothetical protein
MSDTCSCPDCDRPLTGDDIDHTEAPIDDPCSRDANLTPITRRRRAMTTGPPPRNSMR